MAPKVLGAAVHTTDQACAYAPHAEASPGACVVLPWPVLLAELRCSLDALPLELLELSISSFMKHFIHSN